jgi:UDP-N-acetylglucosamine diphosphorylase/glucosamine-1-phosphate N-acetyltransferase
MAMQLILFDDDTARDWMPFALTRPVGELLFGARTFRERAERFTGLRCAGHLAGADLQTFEEAQCAPGLAADQIDERVGRVFWCSRAVPHPGARFSAPSASGVIQVGGQPAGYYAAPGSPSPDSAFLKHPAAAETPAVCAVDGVVLQNVWELITRLADRLREDFRAATNLDAPIAVPPAGSGQVRYEHGLLRVAPTAIIEPGVLFDFSEGPIWIEDGANVRAFTRLAGPAFIGPGSTLLGGSFSGVAIGPVCKVHGEVEETTLLGYSNKAHEGFLGHAYLGRWVNLGALTTNSDLKNNYGTVRMWTPRGEVDTGEMKLGCLLGDHVKTGIGMMINTGTVIGAGSNVYGAPQPPKYVAPFRWGSGDALVGYDFERFLATAETAMDRRNVTLTAGLREVLRHAWQRAQE